VDTYLQSGDEITIHYDPMIAKVIVYDRTRDEAIRRMQQALFEMVVLGVTTNIPFLSTLLAHPMFLAGKVDTAFVDAHLAELVGEADTPDALALIALALTEMHQTAVINTATTALSESDTDRFSPWGRADRFRLHQR
jgi:3-methylcrotonyl-CoA carboxylase alpha subunit